MKKFEKKSAGTLERLRMRSGIYASAVTVLVVVLAVLLNLIVRAVPTKYTEFDLSEAGLYTLSDSSRDIAHALTQDVTIYYLAETGSEDAIITKLLDRYASESSHIKWETKDPAVYPTFAAQYGVQSAENGSLVLVSGEKSAVLAASDLYDYDYSDYYTTGSYSVTFGGENKLTAAIYRITSGEELHAYLHDEPRRTAPHRHPDRRAGRPEPLRQPPRPADGHHPGRLRPAHHQRPAAGRCIGGRPHG